MATYVHVSPARFHRPVELPHRVAVAGELAATAAAILVYFIIRGSHPDDIPASVSRTFALIGLEQHLGIFHEEAVQQAFIHREWVVDLANTVYVWGMYPVLAAVAVWLAIRDLDRFRYVRNIMLVSACMGLAAYWLLPTAPPRLIDSYGGNYGFVDTIHAGSSSVKDVQPAIFVNHYAAIPSFHFAWVALAAAAVWLNTRSLAMRASATTVAVAMFWAIIVTANHLFIDLALGVATVAVAWLLTEAGYRLTERYLRHPRCTVAHVPTAIRASR